jgi:DNA-binding XRE family transcriptional regulator
MAVVVKLPLHGRTSLADRSNASNETNPCDRKTILMRHFGGTPRCFHFLMLLSRAPSARANLPINSQSNVVSLPFMTDTIADDLSACQGQFGSRLNLLNSLSLDMAEEAEEIALHKRIKTHMRIFREGRRWNHQRMAEKLGISKANYQKYELDDPKRKVPLVVVFRYCDLAGISLDDIIQPPRRRA